ncbi:hypothetical protein [Maribacter sp. Asnod1-A12]|uniref:hypothetical protein n=1 Tax=Maribacter sp. Asnod1-A12 TaxID=3160576 RepID=UPI00386D9E4C
MNLKPIFVIKNSGYYAGVDENGDWYSDTAEGLKSVNENGGIGILPILEMNRKDFDIYLTEKIAQSELKSNIKVSELTIKIITLSFDVSTYWAELGIEWLNEKEINSDLKNILNKLIETKQYSPKFRQKALAKIKKYERIKTCT